MDADGFGQDSKNSGQEPEMMNHKMVIKLSSVQFITLSLDQMHMLWNLAFQNTQGPDWINPAFSTRSAQKSAALYAMIILPYLLP